MSDKICISAFASATYAPNCSVDVKYNTENKKEYYPIKGWLDWGEYKSVIEPKHNGLMIDIRKRFIILDADTKEAKHKIIELLKKYKIYTDEYAEKYVTKSISNILKGDKNKKHFWLKKPKHTLTKAINCYGIGLDLIPDVILEHLDSKIDYNYTAMPEAPDALINEILDNTPSKMKQRSKEIEDISIEATKNNIKYTDDFFCDYFDCLDDFRAEDYQNWTQAGMLLASYSNDYFYIWNDFSKRCVDKYPGENALKKMWKTFKGPDEQPDNGITVGTLMYWAKEDDEDKYNELKAKHYKQKTQSNLLNLFLNLNNRDVSQAYFKEFPHKYIFGGDIKNKKSGWFGFKPNNIIINYGAVPTGLLNHISEYMQEQAQKEKMNLSAEIFKVKTDKKIDAEEKQKLLTSISNNIKKVNDAYLKLGSSTFINGCICFLADSYYNEEIDQLLDSNNKIIAFKNGLYDFEKDIFRPIEPTDYISKCTNYDYIPTSNNKLRIQINKLLDSIFGSDDVKKYFMAVHGSSLFSNSSESIYLLNGKGGNGKGLLTSIIQGALGDYFLTAENTFLTSNVKAGAPNPTLAEAKGRRYLSLSEPEDTNMESCFNMGLVKILTGKDQISTRALYKDNISYMPQFTPFIQCNEIPKLKTVDNATKRRFKIINFPFQFVDSPTKSNERLINRGLKEIINKEFYNEFMMMMIEYANQYKNKTLVIPQEVANATNNYFEDNNILLNWFTSYVEITGDTKDKIKTSALYDHYKKACNTDISNVVFMKHLKTFDVTIGAEKGCKFIRGIKLLDIEDDEDVEPNALDL